MEIPDFIISTINDPNALAIYAFTALNNNNVSEMDCIEAFNFTPDEYKEGVKRLLRVGVLERRLILV